MEGAPLLQMPQATKCLQSKGTVTTALALEPALALALAVAPRKSVEECAATESLRIFRDGWECAAKKSWAQQRGFLGKGSGKAKWAVCRDAMVVSVEERRTSSSQHVQSDVKFPFLCASGKQQCNVTCDDDNDTMPLIGSSCAGDRTKEESGSDQAKDEMIVQLKRKTRELTSRCVTEKCHEDSEYELMLNTE
uniref:Uncharacterized protein n=1 Tax=Setaria digitata TaxID=48799 RepID=A0A915PQQ4_9BILA